MSRQLVRDAKESFRLFLSECGRRARVLRDRVQRQPDRIGPSSRFVLGLSPEQVAQYGAKSYFEVTGCHSGKPYRISRGTWMNIYELDGAGRPSVGWCFGPEGYLVAGDVMLAQKIALETDERGALALANKFFVSTDRRIMPLQSRSRRSAASQGGYFGDLSSISKSGRRTAVSGRCLSRITI
jgi:hypothetical protein